MKINQAPNPSIRRKWKATQYVVMSCCLFALLMPALANDTPVVQCDPNWKAVTWETQYDREKLARVRLNPKSLLPGQLAVIKKQEVTFTPENGQPVALDGGWENGGYVFDNWDELLRLLEHSVGDISIKQQAFTENGNHQIFALTPDQQKALQARKGVLALKVTCEMYQLKLRAKISLGAPTPVQDGGIVYQVVNTDKGAGAKASPEAGSPAGKEPEGEVTYLNGKRVSPAEAVATLIGDRETLDVSRKGTIDPTDERPGRTLVYVLVNPEDHTATLLQAVAPNGFFDRKRDPTKMDVVDHLGIAPDKTPLKRKILYVFDPLVGGTTEVTLKDAEFTMRWP